MGKFKFDHWANTYAVRIGSLRSSAIRDLLSVATMPDIISFAGGLPHPLSFPIPEIKEAFEEIMRNQTNLALQYGPTEGLAGLREEIAKMMARDNIKVHPDEIIITNGGQQALDLLGKIFIDPGSTIVLEAPSYVGAINAFLAYEADVAAVPLDNDGMNIEKLEETLASLEDRGVTPKFLYVIPNYQNPGGTTLSPERRKKILEISKSNDLLVIEDNPYGALCFEGERYPSLKVSDPNVVYLGTFSKIFTPGFRVGWVAAPRAIVEKLLLAKQGADLCSSSFGQIMVEEYLKHNDIDAHIRKIIDMYRIRRDAMIKALEEYFPEGTSWTKPRGGLFLWATLPEYIDTDEMLAEAVQEKVTYVPGAAFSADGSMKNSMRLNFSYAEPEEIDKGIKRLGKVIKNQIAIYESFYKPKK